MGEVGVQFPIGPPSPDMKEYMKNLFFGNQKIKKISGVVLVVIGLAILLTPFTPGSWIIFIGLELLGLRFLLWDKINKLFIKK